MNERAFAHNALRALALPVPRSEGRTLNVFLDDKRALPGYRIHCSCPLVANYVWRAAHEQGCTKIRVHASSTHRHEFDTIEFLKRFTIKRLGFLPRPARQADGKVPAKLATAGHIALGNSFDRMRNYVQVGAISAPISAPMGAVEAPNA